MVEDVVRELGHLSLGTRLKRIGETLQAQTQAVLAAHGFEQPAAYFPLLAALDRLGPLSVGELRHELRTPVNHIVGYTEMLLEDTEDPAFADSRVLLQDILSAAREVLLLINGALPPTRSEVSPAELATLYGTIRIPQSRILGAIRNLLA